VFVEGDADLTPAKIVGHHNPARVLREDYSAKNFVDGPLPQAIREGGFLYIEEFNRAPEDTLNTLLTAMAERRIAFENLAARCGHNGVKAVATALNQAEKYGTPLGQALRVAAQENREMRMSEAEKKAASLPAKLTVPMIIFFLPCLFAVIMGPAIIKISHTMHH